VTDEQLLQEAKDRFRRVKEYESEARSRQADDLRFSQGDSTNMFQWPTEIANNRIVSDKPCLTMNRVRQYCLNIVNDSRQHKPSIKINPTGGGASFDAAQIYEGVIRHIEYISNAQQAYDSGSWWQVHAGIGWWRVITDYAHDNTFDQEILIKRISDGFSVWMDPSISEYDGSDARWAFVVRDMDRDIFDRDYPRYRNLVGDALVALPDDDSSGWNDKNRIRVAEYFYRADEDDTLHYMADGSMLRESQVEDRDSLRQNSMRSRDITEPKIKWCLIAGNRIVEKRDWPGRYIPLVRVIGEETVIDKKLDRKGHPRALIDSQRAYNYYSSASIEHVALQSKVPYVTPLLAIEGFENEWKNANISNLAYLPYNHMDDAGQEIPKPAREQPPVFADAYLKGMQVAQNEMSLVSGQFEAVLGEPSNERSGKAIDARQRNALTSTYHYVDHLATAIRYTGKIILDLIPKIYDTPDRVIKILNPDGSQQSVQVNPNMPQSVAKVPALDEESIDPAHISMLWNPTVGEYLVQSDVGPAFQTRRLEAFNALSDIMAQNESVAPLVLDLWAKSSDFPLADVMAERFQRMLPPAATGQGPSQQEQQMQQQIKALQQTIVSQQAELQKQKLKEINKHSDDQISWYDAETKRMATVAGIDPMALRPIIRQLVTEVLGTPAEPVIAAHVASDAAMRHDAGIQTPHADALPPPEPAQPPAQ